jgi:hypothetical protein
MDVTERLVAREARFHPFPGRKLNLQRAVRAERARYRRRGHGRREKARRRALFALDVATLWRDARGCLLRRGRLSATCGEGGAAFCFYVFLQTASLFAHTVQLGAQPCGAAFDPRMSLVVNLAIEAEKLRPPSVSTDEAMRDEKRFRSRHIDYSSLHSLVAHSQTAVLQVFGRIQDIAQDLL